jgi:hypothetical protein
MTRQLATASQTVLSARSDGASQAPCQPATAEEVSEWVLFQMSGVSSHGQ